MPLVNRLPLVVSVISIVGIKSLDWNAHFNRLLPPSGAGEVGLQIRHIIPGLGHFVSSSAPSFVPQNPPFGVGGNLPIGPGLRGTHFGRLVA